MFANIRVPFSSTNKQLWIVVTPVCRVRTAAQSIQVRIRQRSGRPSLRQATDMAALDAESSLRSGSRRAMLHVRTRSCTKSEHNTQTTPNKVTTRRMAIANGTCVSFCNQPKAHFGLPWVRPWDNRGKCYMDGKRIQCYIYTYLSSTVYEL